MFVWINKRVTLSKSLLIAFCITLDKVCGDGFYFVSVDQLTFPSILNPLKKKLISFDLEHGSLTPSKFKFISFGSKNQFDGGSIFNWYSPLSYKGMK